jgi:hypothetical protein
MKQRTVSGCSANKTAISHGRIKSVLISAVPTEEAFTSFDNPVQYGVSRLLNEYSVLIVSCFVC